MINSHHNIKIPFLEVSEERIICNASIDDDFSDSRVLIVMKADESSRLKNYSDADFSEINNIRLRIFPREQDLFPSSLRGEFFTDNFPDAQKTYASPLVNFLTL